MAYAETQTLLARLLLDSSQFEAAASRATGKMGAFGKSIGLAASGASAAVNRSFLVMGGLALIAETAFFKVQESQAALARTMTGETAPAIARVSAQILELSKTIPLSVTELYRIAEVIGTTGIASDSIKGLTKVVAQLASTTDLSADEAAYGMARLLTIFGQVDKEGRIAIGAAEGLGSALTKASLDFASTDQNILRATLRFAALGKQMGLTQGQILALAALGTGLGQEPEAFGGSMQRLLGIFLKYVGTYDELSAKQKKALTEESKFVKLSAIAGLSAKEFSANLKSAPFETITSFLEGLKELSATEQATLFGGGALFPSIVRGQQTVQNLTERIEQLKLAGTDLDSTYKRGTFLSEVFAVRTDTLAKKFQLLQSALVRGAVAFGDAFNEELGDGIGTLTEKIDLALPTIQQWGRELGKWIKGIDWAGVIDWAKTFLGLMKNIVSAVLSLPPQVLGALAAFKAGNFLTGGALGKGLELFLGRGGPLNPLWVKIAGAPVGPGGSGPGSVGWGATIARTIFNFVKLGGILLAVSTAFDIVTKRLGEFDLEVTEAKKNLQTRLDEAKTISGTQAGQAAVAQAGIIAKLAQTGDFVTDLQQTFDILFRKEIREGFLDAYKRLAAQIISDQTLTGSNRRIAVDQLQQLEDAIVALYPAWGGDTSEQDRVRGTLEDILAALIRQNAWVETTLAGNIFPAPKDYGEALGPFFDEQTGLLMGIESNTAKMLAALKPIHRKGERGKSIQSAEFRAIDRLNPDDPTYAGAAPALASRLAKHYKNRPLNAPEHGRFARSAVNESERDLAAQLKEAMKDGNQPAVDAAIKSLRILDSIKGNKLTPGQYALIRAAEAAKKEAKETTGAVKTGATKTSERIENLAAIMRRKRLGVRVNVKPPGVKTGNTYINTRLYATIGTRTVLRALRPSVAYGPGYTLGGSGAFSLYDDNIR